MVSTFSVENLSLYLDKPCAKPNVIFFNSDSLKPSIKFVNYDFIPLNNYSVIGVYIHVNPIYSYNFLANFLSYTI